MSIQNGFNMDNTAIINFKVKKTENGIWHDSYYRGGYTGQYEVYFELHEDNIVIAGDGRSDGGDSTKFKLTLMRTD